ncbi:MAG: multicopper oxidase domain-containing protein [Bacteroidia bacterium]|jgi:blue copper oxidase|nr:multicopper oxidase domain-containing protein [Bacteroidia bacterium]HEX5002697.1 multicopper oxidase domain-containing protein [Bacteroidia bacterium]
MRRIIYCILLSLIVLPGLGQNPLTIPPALTGTTFNLNIQNGVTQFYQGINTPTLGINGSLLAPTLIINKWDWVTMNVTNNLAGFGNSTTIHWHGLHVPAVADGGPHQVILQGATWSPTFQVLNSAGTFWYHPHGDNKTDLHVSRGIAGMIIIKDSVESNLTLPRTYGVDDFPIIVQSKAFDILNQIAISTELDTAICVNGVVDPFLDVPAQVIRLRMLNGSSSRVYNFGFTGNLPFKMIASDGGLLDSSVSMNRLRLAPGERAEILLDLQGMTGQTFHLISFSSEFQNGIYGAATVIGPMGGTIPDYNLNPLNGADFEILQLNVIAQTGSPVTSIPSSLTTNTPYTGFTVSRNFNLLPDTMMSPVGQVEGPFNINGFHFDMGVINETVYLNDTEKWRITNNTGIAHPFHIHDVQFYLLNVNGNTVPVHEQGQKDVVLVLPQQYVEFVTKFEDFANDSVPYMYHCHMLHHEDEGMMGSFVVIDTSTVGITEFEINDDISIFPNPASESLIIESKRNIDESSIQLFNTIGELLSEIRSELPARMNISNLPDGIYFLTISNSNLIVTKKIIKN